MVNMLAADVFRKKGPMDPAFMKRLVVGNDGAAVRENLSAFGTDLTKEPAALVGHSVDPTGRVTGSRLHLRGLLANFTGRAALPAKEIWPTAQDDLALSFKIAGEAINFDSPDAPNVSDWIEFRSLSTFQARKGEEILPPEAWSQEPGIKAGASFRVIIQHFRHTHASMFLQVVLTTVT